MECRLKEAGRQRNPHVTAHAHPHGQSRSASRARVPSKRLSLPLSAVLSPGRRSREVGPCVCGSKQTPRVLSSCGDEAGKNCAAWKKRTRGEKLNSSGKKCTQPKSMQRCTYTQQEQKRVSASPSLPLSLFLSFPHHQDLCSPRTFDSTTTTGSLFLFFSLLRVQLSVLFFLSFFFLFDDSRG